MAMAHLWVAAGVKREGAQSGVMVSTGGYGTGVEVWDAGATSPPLLLGCHGNRLGRGRGTRRGRVISVRRVLL